MAELAWRLQDVNSAKRIYQALYAKGTLESYEAERLILLMRKSSPRCSGPACHALLEPDPPTPLSASCA